MIFSNISRGPGENHNGYLRIYDFYKAEFITPGIEFYNLYNARGIELGENYIRVDIGFVTENGNQPSYFNLDDGSEVGFFENLIFSSHLDDNYRKSTSIDQHQDRYILPLNASSFITAKDEDIYVLDRKSLQIKEQFKLNPLPEGHYSFKEDTDRVNTLYPLTTQDGRQVYLLGTKKEVIFFLEEI